MMLDQIIPTIGSKGAFLLRAPCQQLTIEGEQYTCQAIRRISDYLANNEDIKTDVYVKYGLNDSTYESHLKENVTIASLQSDTGHWLYIPATHILKYPLTNGVPYRASMIGISLPSLPADRDLSSLIAQLKDLVHDALGVDSIVRQVETSRVVLIPHDDHVVRQGLRDAESTGSNTDRSRYMQTWNQLQTALVKIQALEQYILDH